MVRVCAENTRIFQVLLSRAYTVSRPFLFLTLLHSEKGGTRNWEWTQLDSCPQGYSRPEAVVLSNKIEGCWWGCHYLGSGSTSVELVDSKEFFSLALLVSLVCFINSLHLCWSFCFALIFLKIIEPSLSQSHMFTPPFTLPLLAPILSEWLCGAWLPARVQPQLHFKGFLREKHWRLSLVQVVQPGSCITCQKY